MGDVVRDIVITDRHVAVIGIIRVDRIGCGGERVARKHPVRLRHGIGAGFQTGNGIYAAGVKHIIGDGRHFLIGGIFHLDEVTFAVSDREGDGLTLSLCQRSCVNAVQRLCDLDGALARIVAHLHDVAGEVFVIAVVRMFGDGEAVEDAVCLKAFGRLGLLQVIGLTGEEGDAVSALVQ